VGGVGAFILSPTISSSIQQQVVLGFMLLDLSGGNPNYLLSAYKRIKNVKLQ